MSTTGQKTLLIQGIDWAMDRRFFAYIYHDTSSLNFKLFSDIDLGLDILPSNLARHVITYYTLVFDRNSLSNTSSHRALESKSLSFEPNCRRHIYATK